MSDRSRQSGGGFTIIELMLAIAISLILILGVARVFSYSSQAVGAGQALANVSRDARAAAEVMARDFAGAVMDGSPCMIIRSQQVYAFRTPADYAAAKQMTNFAFLRNMPKTAVPDPRYDELGNPVAPYDYGTRSHRVDILSYFAQGAFHRQTANTRTSSSTSGPPAGFVADQTSPEAWVWYGHLALPDNSHLGLAPGVGTVLMEEYARNPGQMTGPDNTTSQLPQGYNPNNLFASQWILGRQAILLQPADFNYKMYDSNGIAQDYLCRPPLLPPRDYTFRTTNQPPPPGPGTSPPPMVGGPGQTVVIPPTGTTATKVPVPWTVPSLYPLDANTPAAVFATPYNTTSPPQQFLMWQSRYDVANTSIAQFRDILKNYIEEQSEGRSRNPPLVNVDWWDPLMTTTRFFGNPFIQKPLIAPTSATSLDPNKQYAQLSPCFLAHCSQFIVEYAGDFLNQDPTTGNVINTYVDGPTDGQVDFVMVPDGHGNFKRQIRWYGLPRAVVAAATGSPVGAVLPLTAPPPNGATTPDGSIIQQQNVYPLADIWQTANNPAQVGGFQKASTPCAPFEKIDTRAFNWTYPGYVRPNQLPQYPNGSAYWPSPNAPTPTAGGTKPPPYLVERNVTAGDDYGAAGRNGQLQDGEFYTCAWGPYDRKPSMIRITITLEDPAGQLGTGQTYEFIYRLGSGNSN